MASVRERPRKDGGTSYAVLYTIDGRQSCATFTDRHVPKAEAKRQAEQFAHLVDTLGPQRALEVAELGDTKRSTSSPLTVREWLTQYVDQMTGIEQSTIDDYRRYISRDIDLIADIPLTALTEVDIAEWVTYLETTGGRSKTGRAPKTIHNLHGFVSAGLSKAVPKYIAANPAAGRRLPKGSSDEHEPVFLSGDDFAILLKAVSEPWRPLVEFLVASGARWGEATALKPSDIDLSENTVSIRRAWKYTPSKGYYIGRPKTKRSKREITVTREVLAKLDLSGDWVFTNTGRGRRNAGGPVRYPNFWRNVWVPAVERSGLVSHPTPHDLRHTCASWMIARGVSLPVVSRYLGHESVAITEAVYVHLDRTSFESAADAIADMLR